MGFIFRSLATRSFWKYALLSNAGIARVFAAVGVIWTFIELLDFLGIYERARYSKFALFPILGSGLIYAAVRVRPVSRVLYKIPGRDLCVEVRIGDLLDSHGEVVISSSTTFDTDISSGLISANSLQGQFATKFFGGKTVDIDAQLSASLVGEPSSSISRPQGKLLEYAIGTVARVQAHGNNYYFLAMSRFEGQTASSNLTMIDSALESLWLHLASQGEFGTVSIPVLGTGRGRVAYPRKKMIERIAQSFLDASRDRLFAKKLVIYVHPSDAENFEVNLFEVKDYLSRSLNV